MRDNMAILCYELGGRIIDIQLNSDTKIGIGRSSDNTLSSPEDELMSRKHCEIFFNKEIGRFIFRDLDSKNGSALNDTHVKGNLQFMTHGDRIRVGKMILYFYDGERDDSTETQLISIASLDTPPQSAGGGRSMNDTIQFGNVGETSAAMAQALGAGALHPPELAVGTVFGSYEIIKEYSSKDFTRIYLANQTTLNRVVAIKLFPAQSDDIDKLLVRAIRSVAPLDHPNLMSYIDVGWTELFVFMVMPFMSEGNLAAHIKRKTLTESEALVHVRTIASALDYCLSNGRTHNNLKDTNILFSEDHELLISDMGLAAWCLEHCHHENSWLTGSAEYIAPECVVGMTDSWKTDQYALGILLFQMLTGEVPFHGSTEQKTALMQINKDLPDPTSVSQQLQLSSQAYQILRIMTAKDPELRFHSWKELTDSINVCLNSKQGQGQGQARKELPNVLNGSPGMKKITMTTSPAPAMKPASSAGGITQSRPALKISPPAAKQIKFKLK